MKYRANVGGGIVEAQKIKDYRFDAKAQQQYLILGDDTRRPQPVLHGMKPMIGDWYVETSTGTTRLRDGSQYEERSAAAIIKAVDFEMVYTRVEEPSISTEQMGKFCEVLGEELVASIEAVGKDVIDATKPTPFEIEETVKEQLTEWAKDVLAKDAVVQNERAMEHFETELTPEEAANLAVVRADIAAQEVSDSNIREADEAEARIEDGE